MATTKAPLAGNPYSGVPTTARVEQEEQSAMSSIRKWDDDFFSKYRYDFPVGVDVATRLGNNISYFRMNYIIITILAVVLGLIANLELFGVLFASFIVWLLIFRKKLRIFSKISPNVKFTVLFLLNLAITLVLSGETLFTLMGVIFTLIFFHAFLMNDELKQRPPSIKKPRQQEPKSSEEEESDEEEARKK
eukprot:TRINITY_DN860_c0_g3_i5.p1 TRINITY_DN860_c0_g3~~TRINITY_DN860_c0_g3_i5.p1  ORF type:complete len:191 (-),score=47.98 TRINITY_DN860_c0_g3_i5:105-677(-)